MNSLDHSTDKPSAEAAPHKTSLSERLVSEHGSLLGDFRQGLADGVEDTKKHPFMEAGALAITAVIGNKLGCMAGLSKLGPLKLAGVGLLAAAAPLTLMELSRRDADGQDKGEASTSLAREAGRLAYHTGILAIAGAATARITWQMEGAAYLKEAAAPTYQRWVEPFHRYYGPKLVRGGGVYKETARTLAERTDNVSRILKWRGQTSDFPVWKEALGI